MPNVFNRLTTKVKDKIAQRNYEKDSKYLGPIDSVFQDRLGICDSTYNDVFEDEDDARSVSSFSTMATVDDNPGTGYTVDKYFYQPVGRRMEKIAFQIAMPFLPPGRVAQYIEDSLFQGYPEFDGWIKRLNSVHITGLNSLVHQTQSNSVIRSSAALSALSRLSPIDYNIQSFYFDFRKRIRNVNLAALSVDKDDLEKKCYLFLETLSWAQSGLWYMNPVYNLRIQTTLQSKASLLKLVQSWRTSDNDALDIIPEACIQFVRAKNHDTLGRGVEEYEMLYFFILFILRFPPFIYYRPTHSKCKQRAQQLYHMLLTTLLRWLDSVLDAYLRDCKYSDYSESKNPTGSELEKRLAIYGLLQYESAITTLLPVTTRRLSEDGPFDFKFLPRNLRHSGKHWTVIHNLIKGSSARTQRLLKSIDELEREIRDSMNVRKSEEKYYKKKRMSNDELNYTLKQAQLVNALESDMNEEFSKVRRENLSWLGMKQYKLGIYFRSHLDWDWDTASCLERLFELPEESVSSAAPIATVNLDAADADTWNISTEATLPQKMKVAYKSATGETKYKTFVMLGQATDDGEEVSVITPEPSSGGMGEAEARKGPGDGTDKGNNTAPAPMTTIDVEVDGHVDGCVAKDDLEETTENLGAKSERDVDQISICSLD